MLKVIVIFSSFFMAMDMSWADPEEIEDEPRWMWFPDGKGTPQKTYMADESGQGRDGLGSRSIPENVEFFLYRQSGRSNLDHREGKSFVGDTDVISGLDQYDGSLPTKIIIHGWMSSDEDPIIQSIKDNYLSVSDMNVIGVNWQHIADNKNYLKAAFQTREVGEFTAQLIDYLVVNKGADLNTFHLIGHSLGAHTVGYAGSFVKSGRIPRISGLDPALPGFEYIAGPDSRLDPTDAEFVDIIHSCAGTLGFAEPLGHVDFFPNGGFNQPGCPLTDQFGCNFYSRMLNLHFFIIFFLF